jgi:hypothetical protein
VPTGPGRDEAGDRIIDLDGGTVELNAGGDGLPPAPAPLAWFGSPRIATLPAAIREDPCPDG